MRQQQRFAQPAVMGGHGPEGAALGQPEAEAQERHVGGLAVGVRSVGFHVGALDEPDVNARVDQGVGVCGRAGEVRLHRGAEPLGQPSLGHFKHAGQHGVRPGRFFGADLHPAAGRQGLRDGGQPLGRRGEVDVESQMREVDGQPHVCRRSRQRARKRQVGLDHAVGARAVADVLAEEIDAGAVAVGQEPLRSDQRVIARRPGDVARGGTPGRRLTARHALDGALQALARRQSEQHLAIHHGDGRIPRSCGWCAAAVVSQAATNTSGAFQRMQTSLVVSDVGSSR